MAECSHSYSSVKNLQNVRTSANLVQLSGEKTKKILVQFEVRPVGRIGSEMLPFEECLSIGKLA